MSGQIRTAVIPAAGLGTRFLPTTKAVPKELIPLLDQPLIQYGVEEAVEAGVERVVIVTSPGKEALERYFSPDPELERRLTDSGDAERARQINKVASLAEFSYVIQEEPRGLGHAVLTAKDAVGQEPFMVILPDDVIWPASDAAPRMMEVYDRFDSAVVAVEEVPLEAVGAYGVVDPEVMDDRVCRVRGLVEKPAPNEAPSRLAIVGRYILPPEIFDCLERTPPGAKGEIQLTDGMALLLEDQAMYAYQFDGTRYDGGTPLGLLKASLDIGLKRPDTRGRVRQIIDGLTGS